MMDPYNTAAVRRVWARVQATQEDRLAAMIADEQHDHRLYLLLARRFPRYRNLFQSIARDELRHAKKLLSLYFSLYRQRAAVATAQPRHDLNLQAALQARCEAERVGAEHYRQAAAAFSEQTALFLALAADEARHAEQLCALLQKLQ